MTECIVFKLIVRHLNYISFCIYLLVYATCFPDISQTIKIVFTVSPKTVCECAIINFIYNFFNILRHAIFLYRINGLK